MEIVDGRPSFWRERVGAYADTIQQLPAKVGVATDKVADLELAADISEKFNKWNPETPSDEYALKTSVASYVYYSERTIDGLCRAASNQWQEGEFVSFCLVGRLIFEYGASIHYLLKQMRCAAPDWAAARTKLTPFFLGSRRGHWLEALNIEQPSSVNILTQINHWVDENPEAEDDYAFLSESCHPNFIQHYYLHRAGSGGDVVFSMLSQRPLDQALHRFVSIIDKAAHSIGQNLLEVSELSKLPPYSASTAS